MRSGWDWGEEWGGRWWGGGWGGKKWEGDRDENCATAGVVAAGRVRWEHGSARIGCATLGPSHDPCGLVT